jgi:Tol biopolymer transport system component
VSILSLAVVLGGCGGSSGGSAAAGSGVSVAGKAKPPPPPPPPESPSRIAYLDGLYNTFDSQISTTIYTMNPDGTGKTPLHVGKDPAWSPDGSLIAYADLVTAPNGDRAPCIFVMDSSGHGVRQLTTPGVIDGYTTSDQYPDWSPDGRYIIFTRGLAVYGSRESIQLVSVQGGPLTTLVQLTNSPGGQMPYAYHPAWRPGGNEIVWHHYYCVDGWWYNELRLLKMDMSSPSPEPIAGSDALLLTDAADPSWSNDGTKLAFAHKDGAGIWVAPFSDGALGAKTRVTTAGAGATWAPGDTTLAYFGTGAKAPYTDVFTVPSTGGSSANLTNTQRAYESRPDWSPAVF